MKSVHFPTVLPASFTLLGIGWNVQEGLLAQVRPSRKHFSVNPVGLRPAQSALPGQLELRLPRNAARLPLQNSHIAWCS